jgi:hypothetical protein
MAYKAARQKLIQILAQHSANALPGQPVVSGRDPERRS